MECSIMQENLLEKYGVNLHINNDFALGVDTLSIDCETDEKDNFVGIAITPNGKDVYYYNHINMLLRDRLQGSTLIGHNLKGDAKWLRLWGLDIKPIQIYMDTMIQSYVINSTKESHSLKDLAKEFLGMTWSTYKEMVHPDLEHPKKKVTLDKQEVERVAQYCGMDCVATYRLYEYFNKTMDDSQKKILDEIEMPLLRLLFEMELNGITIDIEYLKDLDKEYEGDITIQLANVHHYTDGGINLNSPKQLKPFIEKLLGKIIPNTDKNTLNEFRGHEFINALLEYKRTKKIHSTYIKPFVESPTLPKIHTEFNQVTRSRNDEEYKGIQTGRLSSRYPNLQNIPVHGEDGQAIRRLFIPKAGYSLIVADYSQIEYRLLAHFTKEPRLLEAFKNDKDVHTETGNALGVSRDLGKTLNFAAIYGAQSKKIAKTAKVTEQEAADFLKKYWSVLPRVSTWINRTKFEAKAKKGIKTLMGRWIPLPGLAAENPMERYHWERAAINYIIQGSAAEVIKLAMISLTRQGYLPLLTVHDELLFESKNIHKDELEIKNIMENIVKLEVPLTVSIGNGANWADAKQ